MYVTVPFPYCPGLRGGFSKQDAGTWTCIDEGEVMNCAEMFSLLRKVSRHPGQAYHRLHKQLRGTSVSFLRPNLGAERPGNVVMFHVGRSGSKVLGDMLDQHPKIYWDAEVYNYLVMDTTADHSDPLGILRRRMTRAGRKYYGFEIKPVHFRTLGLEPDRFIDNLLGLGFSHFIVLERKNYLRKIISSAIAHQVGVFHRSSGDSLTARQAVIEPQGVAIDNDARPLLHWLRDYRSYFAGLQAYLGEKEMLWLTFEDDIHASPEVAYRKVCGYLDLASDVRPQIRYEKTNPFQVRDLVVNFGEVERELRGTEFEWMLYE